MRLQTPAVKSMPPRHAVSRIGGGLLQLAWIGCIAWVAWTAWSSAAPAAAAPAAEAKGEARKQAEALFNRYVALEHDFDPAIADLYSDTARIVSRRIKASGPPEVLTIPASRYKEQLRKVMPLAKRRRDLSFYTEVTYTAEGAFVRIKAKRYAEYKRFTSPVELLVGPGTGGQWQIFEELSEAHPGPPSSPPTTPAAPPPPAPPAAGSHSGIGSGATE